VMATREPRGVREYSTDEIAVEWQPSLCYHSHNCIRALPAVFDPERRPWVDVEAASADEIEGAVARCPSGALRTRRAGLSEVAAPHVEVTASAQGPLLVRGGVRVLAADGSVLYEGERVALCRCGGSQNKPFCDGTHTTNGFRG
jgi:uncharacterized Fe-S cluster protein YjdI